jgi:hypothetical protein
MGLGLSAVFKSVCYNRSESSAVGVAELNKVECGNKKFQLICCPKWTLFWVSVEADNRWMYTQRWVKHRVDYELFVICRSTGRTKDAMFAANEIFVMYFFLVSLAGQVFGRRMSVQRKGKNYIQVNILLTSASLPRGFVSFLCLIGLFSRSL